MNGKLASEFSEKYFETMFNAEFLAFLNQSYTCTISVPSQIDEYNSGYDAEFKIHNGKATPLFIQYKKCELKYKINPKQYKKNDSVFKFRIYRNSHHQNRQHNLLVDLNTKYKNKALYVVPKFIDKASLLLHFNNGDLRHHVIAIAPTVSVDNKSHYITFSSSNIIYQHSRTPVNINDSAVPLDFISLDDNITKDELSALLCYAKDLGLDDSTYLILLSTKDPF